MAARQRPSRPSPRRTPARLRSGGLPTSTRRTSRVPDAPAPRRGGSRSRLTGRAAVLLLVLAVLAVSYATSTRAWLRQRSEINDLNAQIAQSKVAIAGLQQQQRRWHDPAYVEEQARLRFGWLLPGQTGYRVIGPEGRVLAGRTNELSTPVRHPAEKAQWWQPVLNSVTAAGTPPTPTRKQAHRPRHHPPAKLTDSGLHTGG